MKILITGGTGFIGRQLCRLLLEKNHQLTVLSRRPGKVAKLCGPSVQAINHIDQLTSEDSFDAIINLAGDGIADNRWTEKRKKQLLDSRIKITEQLVAYIERAEHKPDVLISGSAVGYYGDHGSLILNEDFAPQDLFSSVLCDQWEYAALQAENYAVRVCIIRIGLVLGHDGGFLKRMLLPFKLGLGSTFGNGEQWMSWIHRDDLIAIINKLLESTVLQGPFNATAPDPVTNKEFCKTLGRILKRPVFLSVPAFVLKLFLGEMSELLLVGQRVMPSRLSKAGFEFQFNTLTAALKDVLK